jgi:squalene synthase HpnC
VPPILRECDCPDHGGDWQLPFGLRMIRGVNRTPAQRQPGDDAATASTVGKLAGLGGDGEAAGFEAATRLATTQYENFSVLSMLVPRDLRPDFAAVYAFCRRADDLADEHDGSPAAREKALTDLAALRRQLHAISPDGAAKVEQPASSAVEVDPMMAALGVTMRRRSLAREPFDHLIDAFEQDQRVTRYDTMAQVLEYCARSANPVGRIVLMLAGGSIADHTPRVANVQAAAERDVVAMSDCVCTALQLTNFWQDIRRDLVDRDRVYLPRECGIDDSTLRRWIETPGDPAARLPFIQTLRPLVDHARGFFDAAAGLPSMVPRQIAGPVWLFAAGGRAVLEKIEKTGCTTLWARPKLGKIDKALLLARAWVMFGRQR